MIEKAAFAAVPPIRTRNPDLSNCSTTRYQSPQPFFRTRANRSATQMKAEPTLRCVRCGSNFLQSENSATSCYYHGDVLGNPMPLNLYEDHHFDDETLDGVQGPRYGRRWACCQDTDPEAPPCKVGFHVSYGCDPARWTESITFAVK